MQLLRLILCVLKHLFALRTELLFLSWKKGQGWRSQVPCIISFSICMKAEWLFVRWNQKLYSQRRLLWWPCLIFSPLDDIRPLPINLFLNYSMVKKKKKLKDLLVWFSSPSSHCPLLYICKAEQIPTSKCLLLIKVLLDWLFKLCLDLFKISRIAFCCLLLKSIWIILTNLCCIYMSVSWGHSHAVGSVMQHSIAVFVTSVSAITGPRRPIYSFTCCLFQHSWSPLGSLVIWSPT